MGRAVSVTIPLQFVLFSGINVHDLNETVLLFIGAGKAPDADVPSGPYPFWVKQSNTNKRVPVVQAYCYTKYLGKLWIEFDEAGEVTRSYGNPILLDSHLGQGIP